MADRLGIIQKLEDKVAAALRDHNLTAAAGGTPAAQSAMAEYNRLVQDASFLTGIKYLALHSVAVKQGFYVDKRDQQEMLGTVAQEMGNLSPTEVLAGIQRLKSNYPAIYQCDAVAIDRKESSIVEFMARLPIDQQDQAVVKAKNVQLNARLIQPEARENPVVATEPFIQPSQSQPVESPISKKQSYAVQQSKLPRAHSSESDRNKLDFEPIYTRQQTKISEESILIPLKNLWIGVLLLFCSASGVALSLLSNFSSRSTQSYVDQVKVNQEVDKKAQTSTNSQNGFIVSQPISSPTSAPIVLQSKPANNPGSLMPESFGGNTNNDVNLSNPVAVRPATPKSNITKSLSVRQEAEQALEISSGASASIANSPTELSNTAAISQDEAKKLIERWMQAKQKMFAPPYDQELGSQLATGKTYTDKVKGPSSDGTPYSSLEWLRQYGFQYRYGIQNIEGVTRFQSSANQASIEVQILEDAKLYNKNGIIQPKRSGMERKKVRFILENDNGVFKISDYDVIGESKRKS